MLISAIFGGAIGVGITLLVQRRRRFQEARLKAADDQGALNTPQLLAWIDAATQGWMILAPDLSIAYINSRAERLLHISRNFLVRGMLLDDVLSIPQLPRSPHRLPSPWLLSLGHRW